MATAPLPANDTHDPLADADLECNFLGLLLCDNAHIDRAADVLRPEDFSNGTARQIYEAILHAAGQGKAANPATLRGCVDDAKLLFELTSNPASWLLPKDAALQIAELASRRRMRDGLTQAASECAVLTTPASEIVTLADAAVAPKAAGNVRETSASRCMADYIDGIDAPHHGVLCGSIPTLDDLHGPMEPSQLIILAARPGMGKTALALSYAIGAAKAGHGVLFASLEMNGEQLAGRMLADLCFDGEKVPYAAIRDRELNDFQRRRLAEEESRARGLPLRVLDAGSLTPARLGMIARRTARRFAGKGHDLKLIVVDYLQLMRPDSGTNKPYEAVSEVSRALKALAKDSGVPVLALAQLSREVEKRSDKRPQLSDLRDSGQIEQDADSVVFLLRHEYYLHQCEPDQMDPKRAEWEHAMEQARGKIEFILAKRRNGTTGTAIGQFHGAYQSVR